MEDSGLDDFFAKKDKTKKKTKAAKSGDNMGEKTEKPKKIKKKKDKQSNETAQPGAPKTKKDEDDQWLDYVEEEEKDFSDLKIQNLQIGNKEADEDGDRGDGGASDNEDGDGKPRKDGVSGPWAARAAKPESDAPAAEPEVVVAPPEPPKEEPAKTTGKYIPPGMRRAMESGASGGSLNPMRMGYGGRRGKKNAPNVMSEEEFPTLGGGPGDGPNDSGGASYVAKFEQVRGGGRQTDDPRAKSHHVELGNKFDALAGAES